MFNQYRQRSGRTRLRHLAIAASGLAVAGVLLGSVASAAGAAGRPATVHATARVSAPQPSITSVSFRGLSGPGVSSPTITVTGTNFGASAPPGTGNNTTSCGPYTANGNVYGRQLYFTDDANFEAGYSNTLGATCIGIIVQSWSPTKVVLQFGNAYGTFAHWYLTNGDGYAISIKSGIWGGRVRGLSLP